MKIETKITLNETICVEQDKITIIPTEENGYGTWMNFDRAIEDLKLAEGDYKVTITIERVQN